MLVAEAYKIIDTRDLDRVVERIKQQGKRLVLVTGVFDLLHEGHKQFLHKAKAVGEVLLVGVESNIRVRRLKGDGRPVQLVTTRMEALAELSWVDGVFGLPEQFDDKQDHEALISVIRPDLLAVSEHTPHLAEKQELVEKYGGELKVVMAENPQFSTTKLVEEAA